MSPFRLIYININIFIQISPFWLLYIYTHVTFLAEHIFISIYTNVIFWAEYINIYLYKFLNKFLASKYLYKSIQMSPSWLLYILYIYIYIQMSPFG